MEISSKEMRKSLAIKVSFLKYRIPFIFTVQLKPPTFAGKAVFRVSADSTSCLCGFEASVLEAIVLFPVLFVQETKNNTKKIRIIPFINLGFSAILP